MIPTLSETLKSAIGRRIASVYGSVHVIKDQLGETTPSDLWFDFEGGPSFGIRGTSRGECIELADRAPHPLNMGDAGEIVVRDLQGNIHVGQVMGRVLNGAWLIKPASWGSADDVIGVRLDFGLWKGLAISVWSDEIEMTSDDSIELGAEWPVVEVSV